jgi:putative ABC transport system permease protein
VAVVNEALVRRFFGQMEPVGSRLWMPGEEGGEERLFEIVGVVRDAKPQDFIGEPPAMAYFSFFQLYSPPGNALLISTTIDPATSIPLLYKWLREFEPYIAIVNALPYTEVVRGFLYSQRMNAELFSTLAILGLGLAAVGIFSVVTLAVSRRTREIGVRMALGAQRADIGRLILGRALTPVAIGLGLGLAASLAVTRLVRNLLHGVDPIDPITLALGAVVLVVAATTAAFLPARRAAAVDPMTALRSD